MLILASQLTQRIFINTRAIQGLQNFSRQFEPKIMLMDVARVLKCGHFEILIHYLEIS